MRIAILMYLVLAIGIQAARAETLELTMRYQQPMDEGAQRFHRMHRSETWEADQTAVIVCDMWDAHHCLNAVRRVNELAPRIEAFTSALRGQGVTIIHAPSSCMDAYAGHPARARASSVAPAANMPSDIASWCDQIPTEEAAAYPLDQAEGGEDDDLAEHELWAAQLKASGRNPQAPWLAQCDAIRIDAARDYISDSGTEIWSILENKGINNVILVGVHTNMCVLGRPFGLRRLAAAGKHVVLARDLTDTMYDPRAWPFANHFTGTDLIVSHVERYVCPTISSSQILGNAFRFSADNRPRLVILVAENEYKTEKSLPAFAAKHLNRHFQVSFCYGSEDEPNRIVSIDEIQNADALLISVRRRPLPPADLALIQDFVKSGRPVIGIRTASHAFSLRNAEPEAGLAAWPELDRQVWGGSYTNHYGHDVPWRLDAAESAAEHSIMRAIGPLSIRPTGSLYKTAPLAAGTHVLMSGTVEGESPEPVAWTFVRRDGGRSFYTSLGHEDEFAQAQFEALLSAGIHWACGLEPHSLAEVELQNQRYAAGQGKQRR